MLSVFVGGSVECRTRVNDSFCAVSLSGATQIKYQDHCSVKPPVAATQALSLRTQQLRNVLYCTQDACKHLGLEEKMRLWCMDWWQESVMCASGAMWKIFCFDIYIFI